VKEAYLRGTEDNFSALSSRPLIEVYIEVGAENSLHSMAAYRGALHRKTLVLLARYLMY
jgi:hypothetical protein